MGAMAWRMTSWGRMMGAVVAIPGRWCGISRSSSRHTSRTTGGTQMSHSFTGGATLKRYHACASSRHGLCLGPSCHKLYQQASKPGTVQHEGRACCSVACRQPDRSERATQLMAICPKQRSWKCAYPMWRTLRVSCALHTRHASVCQKPPSTAPDEEHPVWPPHHRQQLNKDPSSLLVDLVHVRLHAPQLGAELEQRPAEYLPLVRGINQVGVVQCNWLC